jgi:hypothetical protein
MARLYTEGAALGAGSSLSLVVRASGLTCLFPRVDERATEWAFLRRAIHPTERPSNRTGP